METTVQKQEEQYKVVVNDEEQYSIWPVERPNPPGWHDANKDGTKDECLDHIEKVWTDMRPLSVRKHLAALEARRQKQKSGTGQTDAGN